MGRLKLINMEAKDLMIGDYVYNHRNWECPILEIHKDSAVVIARHYGEEEFLLSDLRPIPLTPKILEKNGFEKVLDEDGTECYRYYNSAADGYIKISLYYGGDGDWSIEIVNYEKFNDNEIVYNNNFIFLKVHQLQHALRFCGIGKEIEL